MSRFTKRPRLLVVLIALLGALLLTENVALAALTLTRTGKAVAALKTVATDAVVSTSSEVFTDVPGMSLSVSVPDGTKALFMIDFSANSRCQSQGAGYCQLRAVADGTAVFPSPMYVPGATAWEVRTAHWIAGPFAAGSHVIKIQYFAPSIPETFYLNNMTLTVLRSKV
jgi:hypothetical protein